MNGPRPRADRRRDTEHRLRTDVDLWLASASADGAAWLVSLSFDWDGEAILVATARATPTGRNLARGGRVRLGLGPTRDVTMIDGDTTVLALDELAPEAADRFVARAGFDPRLGGDGYAWYRIVPRRVQAWREVDELADRELMRDGQWLV